jgi:hypothetical protein
MTIRNEIEKVTYTTKNICLKKDNKKNRVSYQWNSVQTKPTCEGEKQI